ncbi:MAG: transposase [Acidobacteria bacterium]|nr:transposase [Acidobacteriota bacterium]
MKTRLWKGHLWSPSYFVVTVGGAPLEVIKKYVETQVPYKSASIHDISDESALTLMS